MTQIIQISVEVPIIKQCFSVIDRNMNYKKREKVNIRPGRDKKKSNESFLFFYGLRDFVKEVKHFDRDLSPAVYTSDTD